jgi:hypothetical protein
MAYLAERILKEPSFEIRPLGRGFPKTKRQYVMGFDTEQDTAAKEPFLLQIAHPGGEVALLDVDGDTILDALMHHLDDRCRDTKTTYTLFGFNLSYEYTQLFGRLPEMSWSYADIVYDAGWFRLEVYNDKRHTFTIHFRGGRTIKVLDAMAFIPTSLNQAGKMLGIGEKESTPRIFARSERHDPEFVAYAEQDARLTQRLGEHIVGWHREQDVPIALSASHFAAQVYRRRYLSDSIPRPSPELEQLGLDAYHGGKNAYYIEEPREWGVAHAYDIRSAYSEAMASLPDVESGVWYPTKDIVPHALYRATVVYHGCRYHPLWGVLEAGRYVHPVTGYEVLSALSCGCIDIHALEGYELRGGKHGSLWSYVTDIFAEKRHATLPADKVVKKLLLNGLYGKFFQKVPLGKAATYDLRTGEVVINDWTLPYDYVAGGLYHPPIAALITGYVRAKIHTLEHRYRAVMTSTDGIFGTQSPLATDIGEGLGRLEHKVGRLRVWRERLYIFDADDGERKFAGHGFRAKAPVLEQIPLEHGSWEYNATQATTLRMALASKGKLKPGEFVDGALFHVVI